MLLQKMTIPQNLPDAYVMSGDEQSNNSSSKSSVSIQMISIQNENGK
jgi:hypothetical protein